MNLAKKMLIVAIMAMLYQGIKAQVTTTYAMDSPSFVLMSQDVSKYETIDQSYLNLVYHFKTKSSALEVMTPLAEFFNLMLMAG